MNGREEKALPQRKIPINKDRRSDANRKSPTDNTVIIVFGKNYQWML